MGRNHEMHQYEIRNKGPESKTEKENRGPRTYFKGPRNYVKKKKKKLTFGVLAELQNKKTIIPNTDRV